jgi:hypothetical protein
LDIFERAVKTAAAFRLVSILGNALVLSSELNGISGVYHLSEIPVKRISEQETTTTSNHHWHTICTMCSMRREDHQATIKAHAVLHAANTQHTPLSPFNNPLQFSDAAHLNPNLSPTDPRMLIATMTKTRHQCRSAGLIPRDTRELIHIGKTLNLASIHTQQIIEIARRDPFSPSLNDSQVTELAAIPFLHTQKKTRIPIRVLIGLSIWALTIVVAMLVV